MKMETINCLIGFVAPKNVSVSIFNDGDGLQIRVNPVRGDYPIVEFWVGESARELYRQLSFACREINFFLNG